MLNLLFSLSLSVTTQLELDQIFTASELKGAIVAVCVTNLNGKVLYSKNPDTLVVPGSNQKLLTGLYALETLGANFRPTISFWKQMDQVIVATSGHPVLTWSQLRQVREELGIRSNTKIQLDQAYRPLFPPTWELDDLPNKYAAPITAFAVDRAAFELWAKAGKLEPLPKELGIQVRHIPRKGNPKINYDPVLKTLWVTGTLPQTLTRLDTLAMPEPDKVAARILGGMKAEVVLGSGAPRSAPGLVIQGPPIRQILKICLTDSDNFIAEHLLLMSCLKSNSLNLEPYSVAQLDINKFLQRTLKREDLPIKVYDGSGMSRHNLLTAKLICELLSWANKQPWIDVFKNALAKPGEGTLKKRLLHNSFNGKTGTLDSVSALSGYLTTYQGQQLCVSLIINHYLSPASKIKEIENKFIQTLEITGINGTFSALSWSHANNDSYSRFSSAFAYWNPRLHYDSCPSRTGVDYRVESPDAPILRSK